jgi:hypothetical protein
MKKERVMNIRTMITSLAAVALLCVVQTSFSWTHNFWNATPYTVHFHAEWAACASEGFDLAPGGMRTFKGKCGGGGLLTKVKITVKNVPVNPVPGQVVSTNFTNIQGKMNYNSSGTGSGTWIAYGPMYERVGNNVVSFYGVTKRVE